MSGPYQRCDLSNCGAGRLRVAINCGVLNVKEIIDSHYVYLLHLLWMRVTPLIKKKMIKRKSIHYGVVDV